MRIEVVIPYAGDCPWRARALEWAAGRWPWPVTVARGPSPWSKGAAVNPAVWSSSADVVLVADADVVCDAREAVAAVEAGAAWAIPHRGVHRLTREGTEAVYAGEPGDAQALDERPYLGVEGGGVVIARRETLIEIPLDPRFVGWGQEDESWAVAMRAMLGEPWRGREPLIHLWHPPEPRISRRRGSRDGWALRRRYFKAQHSQDAMRALLQEARDELQLQAGLPVLRVPTMQAEAPVDVARSPDQPAVRDQAA